MSSALDPDRVDFSRKDNRHRGFRTEARLVARVLRIYG
jgi:hypothetical protein